MRPALFKSLFLSLLIRDSGDIYTTSSSSTTVLSMAMVGLARLFCFVRAEQRKWPTTRAVTISGLEGSFQVVEMEKNCVHNSRTLLQWWFVTRAARGKDSSQSLFSFLVSSLALASILQIFQTTVVDVIRMLMVACSSVMFDILRSLTEVETETETETETKKESQLWVVFNFALKTHIWNLLQSGTSGSENLWSNTFCTELPKTSNLIRVCSPLAEETTL